MRRAYRSLKWDAILFVRDTLAKVRGRWWRARRAARRFVSEYRELFRFWWRKPARGTFDCTPSTPPRKVFGTHLPSRNGAFRPTLWDVVSGKARMHFFYPERKYRA